VSDVFTETAISFKQSNIYPKNVLNASLVGLQQQLYNLTFRYLAFAIFILVSKYCRKSCHFFADATYGKVPRHAAGVWTYKYRRQHVITTSCKLLNHQFVQLMMTDTS